VNSGIEVMPNLAIVIPFETVVDDVLPHLYASVSPQLNTTPASGQFTKTLQGIIE